MGLGNLFKNLFGSKSGDDGSSLKGGKPSDPVEYNGFVIIPEPINEGGQFRTAGRILKDVDGTTKETRFIRADNNGDYQGAVDHCVYKGKQIIDEQGDAILSREMV